MCWKRKMASLTPAEEGVKMVYQGKLVLKKVESAEIDQLLNACSGRKEGNDACGENCPVKEFKDCVIFHIVSFLNGKSMDIRAVFG